MDFESLFETASASSGLPSILLKAIAWTESSMVPTADAGAGDGVGLMMVTMPTAWALGFRGTRDELKDPAINVKFGTLAALDIVQRQGGLARLNLANFYSEYNSGKAQLWRTSTEVASHVRNFLVNFARLSAIPLPDDVSIDEALGEVAAIPAASLIPVLIALALIFYFKQGGH